jgi:hypothetical protein
VKEHMDNHKFTYLSDGALTSKYFIVKDSVQLEYSDGQLYSESIIKWNSCTEYSLFIRKIYYTDAGLQPGDTLRVKVNFLSKDTLLCNASAYNQRFAFKIFRNY